MFNCDFKQLNFYVSGPLKEALQGQNFYGIDEVKGTAH
jgi:hypothetical protein